MESGYAYPERSDLQFCIGSEVSRGHSKPDTSFQRGEVSHKEEGPNVRRAKGTRTFGVKR